VSRHRNGYLDRGPYIWRRVRTPRGKLARGFGFFSEASGTLEAYLFMTQERDGADIDHDLRLTDVVARNEEAHRAVFAWLFDQRSLVGSVILKRGPSDAFISLLDEALYKEVAQIDWMVRIARLDKALEARAYPKSVVQTLSLDVSDDLVDQNRGPVEIRIEGGQGTVRKGGPGRVKLDIRALAPLYTGYLSPWDLAVMGWISGAGPDDLEALDDVFRARTPGMTEMF
jgi:predicted acetyltransferase